MWHKRDYRKCEFRFCDGKQRIEELEAENAALKNVGVTRHAEGRSEMTNKTTEPAALAGIEPVAFMDHNVRLVQKREYLTAFTTKEALPLYSAATVERLVQEWDELDKLYGLQFNENNDLVRERKTLKDQLAASQAREQQLRCIMLEAWQDSDWLLISNALHGEVLQDDTALRQWGADAQLLEGSCSTGMILDYVRD